MILHTIVPYEIVFDTNYYDKDKLGVTCEIIYKGQRVEAVSCRKNKYVIKRVLSTSPEAYLNPELQPGREVVPD